MRATDNLIGLINAANDEVHDNVAEFVGERFERRLSEEVRGAEARLDKRITDEVAGLRVEMAEVRAVLDKRITEEAAGLRVGMADLRVELSGLQVGIANARSDLIRWTFAFWVGQTAVIVALFTLLR